MAYDRDDRKPTFPLGEFASHGNMVDDPKEIGKGDSTVVAFKVAFNSRNYKEYEGSLFVSCTVRGLTAERVLADGAKGKKVYVKGELFADEPWENKEGDLVPSFSMNVREIAESWKFPEKSGDGGGSRRRRDDDEDDTRGRSGRSSRRRDEDEDEPRGRSGRSSRTSKDEEDEPRGRSARSSRSSRDEEERPARSARSSRSRGGVEDGGDSVDD